MKKLLFVLLLLAHSAFAATTVSRYRIIQADAFWSKKSDLGTIAGAGTATISLNTNRYVLSASGSTIFLNLPTIPDSTNIAVAIIDATNTFGSSQVATWQVGGVTTSLSRPEVGLLTTSTFTNSAGARWIAMAVGINGAWSWFSVIGDQLSGIGLTASDINTQAKLIGIAADLFSAPPISDFSNAQHTHATASGGGQLAETALALTDVTTANASTNAHGFLRKGDNDPTHFLNGQLSWVPSSGGGGGTVVLGRGVSFDGAGSALVTNVVQYIIMPAAGTIQSVTMLSDVNGSALVDIWKTNYTSYPPTSASSIVASAKPTITSTNKYTDSTLTGWTKAFNAGDIFAIHLDTSSTMTFLSVELTISTTGGLLMMTFDGGGVAVPTNMVRSVSIPFACTITNATLISDLNTTAAVDVWDTSYANYPPTVANTITASAIPTLSSTNKSQDNSLPGWSPTVNSGDTMSFRLNSNTTATWITLILGITK